MPLNQSHRFSEEDIALAIATYRLDGDAVRRDADVAALRPDTVSFSRFSKKLASWRKEKKSGKYADGRGNWVSEGKQVYDMVCAFAETPALRSSDT